MQTLWLLTFVVVLRTLRHRVRDGLHGDHWVALVLQRGTNSEGARQKCCRSLGLTPNCGPLRHPVGVPNPAAATAELLKAVPAPPDAPFQSGGYRKRAGQQVGYPASWLASEPNNTPTRTEGGLSPPHARAGCSRLGLTVAPGVRHRHRVTSRHGTLAVVNKTRRCDGRTGSSFPDVASA